MEDITKINDQIRMLNINPNLSIFKKRAMVYNLLGQTIKLSDNWFHNEYLKKINILPINSYLKKFYSCKDETLCVSFETFVFSLLNIFYYWPYIFISQVNILRTAAVSSFQSEDCQNNVLVLCFIKLKYSYVTVRS